MAKSTRLPASAWDFTSFEWPEQDAVVAGGDLEPETILGAYALGLFPMPYEGELVWWSPLRRGVLQPQDLRVSRSLRRSMRRFTVTFNTEFEAVIDHCADPSRSGSWIDRDIRDAYVRLHQLGWAHSVETRDEDGRLVGGLYGVSLGGLFAGESMFHHRTDASKVALVALVERMETLNDWLIDTQWATPHLMSLGVTELARHDYQGRIRHLSTLSSPFLR